MKPIAIVNKTSEKYLEINFVTSNTCNYSCSYCWPECHAGTSRWPDFDRACRSFDHLLDVYKVLGKEEIRLLCSGGEPTLWPKFADFVKYIRDKHDIRVTIATNGSRTTRWWKEHSELFSDVHISIHHEYADPNHIIEVADIIYAKRKSMVSVGALMHPVRWQQCVDNIEKFLNSGSEWMIKVAPLVDPGQNEKIMVYTQEQLDYLDEKIKRFPPDDFIQEMKDLGNIQLDKTEAYVHFDNGEVQPYKKFDLMKNGQNSFVGWKCNLIKDRVMIWHDGKIHSNCFQNEMFDGKDLSIYQDDFVEKFTPDIIKPVICRQAFCSCSGDIRLTKYKNDLPE